MAGEPYLSVHDFGTALGAPPTELGPSVVLRTDFGTLTLFHGSSDYVWSSGLEAGPREGQLPAPVREDGGELWAPLGLVPALGGSISGRVVIMPDRSRLLLADAQTGAAAPPLLTEDTPGPPARHAVVELANGVQALQLHGDSGSLLLVDAGLLALAFPDLRRELDVFNADAHGFRPLYFVFAAHEETAFPAAVTFRQEGLTETAEFSAETVVLQGDAAAVEPGGPLSGVLLLPVTADLRRPLRVQWQEVDSEFRFRK